jgi:hypothetical protein
MKSKLVSLIGEACGHNFMKGKNGEESRMVTWTTLPSFFIRRQLKKR